MILLIPEILVRLLHLNLDKPSMEKFEEVRAMLHSGLQELSTNWEEIGFDENALSDRKRTVFKVLSNLIDQMTTEEKGINDLLGN